MEPWYANGLRFGCTQCGACCSGDPGAVWVNDAEIEALAARLELTSQAFSSRYVRQLGDGRSLTEFDNGDCVFFDPATRGCRVYESRPMQCRTWPFWRSNLRHEKTWQDTAAVCPGSGQGALVPLDRIRQHLVDHDDAKRQGIEAMRAILNVEHSS